MSQILDMVAALDGLDANEKGKRRIVWRLTEAHTNSPPFTVTAQAFSKDPEVSVVIEAARVVDQWSKAISSLLSGEKPFGLDQKVASSLERAFRRNLNGIALTDTKIDRDHAFSIVPAKAQIAIAALEKAEAQRALDLRRSEFGTVEGEVVGLTTYNNRPALVFQERLSGANAICVLSEHLANELGQMHKWSEVWEGRSLRLTGELTYKDDGSLKRVSASRYEEIQWASVDLRDIKKVDILQGRTVQEHMDEFWGERFG